MIELVKEDFYVKGVFTMKKGIIRLRGVRTLFALCWGGMLVPIDLHEELLSKPEGGAHEIMSQSASLSPARKQAIEAALAKIFADQMASTSVYGEIMQALATALHAPQVTESSKRFVAGLKDLIKTFFKNVTLSPEQCAKVRDVLETLKALAVLQGKQLESQSVDDAMANQIMALRERLSAHVMPMAVSMQDMLSQEGAQNHQKYIVEFVLDLIKDILAILPAESNLQGAGNPPALAEPLIPERIELADEDGELSE